MEKLLEVDHLTKVFSLGSILSRVQDHGGGQCVV